MQKIGMIWRPLINYSLSIYQLNILRSDFHSNNIMINILIDMYFKFMNIQKAHVLFDKMQ